MSKPVRTATGHASELDFYPDRVVKRFLGRDAVRRAQGELQFYLAVPWAVPKLLGHGSGWLATERLQVASRLPNWVPGEPFWNLLRRLGERSIHHRDSHGANVLVSPDGRHCLIDWDVAIFYPGRGGLSYDIVGPEVSGVPRPQQHQKRVEGIWWHPEQKAKYPRPKKALV